MSLLSRALNNWALQVHVAKDKSILRDANGTDLPSFQLNLHVVFLKKIQLNTVWLKYEKPLYRVITPTKIFYKVNKKNRETLQQFSNKLSL